MAAKRKTTTSSNSPPPAWRIAEMFAALLEKSITPDAKVEHNIFLPVIGENRTRQCDVVITYGEEPRTHFAIVEVQKRNDKPTIGEFDGWVEKMNEVGASSLICVSAAGYPSSVISKVAKKIGPRARLLTLKELQDPANANPLRKRSRPRLGGRRLA